MITRLFFLINFLWMAVSWANEREKVHIVSYVRYLLPSEEVPYQYYLLKENYNVEFFHYPYRNKGYDYVNNFPGDDPLLKKIIFFEYRLQPNMAKLPKSKMICFRWEAIKIQPHLYDYYDHVYTIDDDLIDNKKYFKFYYPVLQPMLSPIPSFNEKKLCVMCNSNWSVPNGVPERIALVDFFSNKPKDSFHFYGKRTPQKYSNSEMYKGNIPGFHSGPEKLNVFKNYKFCVCFENTHTTPGYITEKIFDVFAAGCVPIYWGPNNIETYIPANCFIDYRKFKNNQEMYDYITSMTEEEYEGFLSHIREFLVSENASLFSQENYEKILYQAVSGHFDPRVELKNWYHQACHKTSDINQHIPVLKGLAKECANVVGIGDASAMWGLLQGLSESHATHPSYLGIDLELPDHLSEAKRIANENGVEFDCMQANAMDILIPPTDLLFIDSLHTYCHLTYELETFSPSVSKYIAMHDTSAPWGSSDDTAYQGDYSEYPESYDRTKRGLWPAVEDFLESHPEWVLHKRLLNNHGLTILKRVDSDHP